MKRICCFVLALGLRLVALGAQEVPPLAAGARVRVVAPKPICTYPEAAPCYRKVVGLLQSIDSTTIVVQRENGETVNVPRAPGTRLDVSTRRGPCGGHRGACIGVGFFGGAFGGVALGAVLGALAVRSPCGAGTCVNTWVYAAAVPAGALVGTIIGAAVRGEDWERADLPARLSVGRGGCGRFAVGLSLRF